MTKNLVIVESPAKAKTIEGYLGRHYKVASCNGHVRDLPKNKKAVNVEDGFKPTYEISEDRQQIIKQLKKLVEESQLVYLASDDDREGESISWHLKEALDLNDAKTRRIVFREITQNAILNALQNPRGIDLDLVNSQQARRVLDRLVGYELSPILWKKIKSGLSAGRVQSVAVKLVVERERAISDFKLTASFKVTALFDLEDNKQLSAALSEKFQSEKVAYQFLEQCKDAVFRIKSLEKKAAKKSPAPPFTTSTLQQEASRKLGYSVTRTMRWAQYLYEAGKISYMRTDSVSLSEEAIEGARKEIYATHGSDYFHKRVYKTKSAAAQEAHEAIRPTNFSQKAVSKEEGAQRLYELIWKRSIASQMADAQLEKTTATIAISTVPQTLIAKGEVVRFEGFLKVYVESRDEEGDELEKTTMLPPLTIGQILTLHHMKARESFSRPPARYTEASLVRQLEERGIGRPSTYAPIISTIQKRAYVSKESREGKARNYTVLTLKDKQINQEKLTEITGAEKNKLFPTDIAMVVNDFLVAHFPNVTDYSFTATIEEKLDKIAQGGKAWDTMIAEFYSEFHPKVEKTENIERSAIKTGRLLGHDPKTGKPVTARLGKYGPFIQVGESEGDQKPKSASLRKGQLIENITLEEALVLLKLPRAVGSFEANPIVADIGRYGPYVRHDNKFYAIGKEDDPFTIDHETAIKLIQAKRKAEAEKLIKVFDENPDVQILNGRWGPYIKAGKKNVRVPKDKDPCQLTLQECVEMIKNAPTRRRKGKKLG